VDEKYDANDKRYQMDENAKRLSQSMNLNLLNENIMQMNRDEI
jgi:hypothetical protein